MVLLQFHKLGYLDLIFERESFDDGFPVYFSGGEAIGSHHASAWRNALFDEVESGTYRLDTDGGHKS